MAAYSTYSSPDKHTKRSFIKNILSFYSESSLGKRLEVWALFQQLSVILIHRSKVLLMSNQTVSLEAAAFLNAGTGTVALTDHRSTVSLSRFLDVIPATVSLLFFTLTSLQTGAGEANEAQSTQRFRKLNQEL